MKAWMWDHRLWIALWAIVGIVLVNFTKVAIEELLEFLKREKTQ